MLLFPEGLKKKISRYIFNPYGREYLRLLIKWGKQKRYETKHNVKVLDYVLTIPDALTFLGQFEEIFLNEAYRFNATTTNPVIIDCGANIGMSCIGYKRIFPHAAITAFEPDPALFSILTENLRRNGFDDVVLINKATWIKKGRIRFSVEGADGGSVYGNNNRIEVQTVRLRDVIKQYSSIDFLKIDIEGAEDQVVLDCGHSLRLAKNIFVEYHSWRNREQQLGVILKVLESNGFRYTIESKLRGTAPLTHTEGTDLIDLHVNIYGRRQD